MERCRGELEKMRAYMEDWTVQRQLRMGQQLVDPRGQQLAPTDASGPIYKLQANDSSCYSSVIVGGAHSGALRHTVDLPSRSCAPLTP